MKGKDEMDERNRKEEFAAYIALMQCAEWFQGYADGHTAKGDADKAKRNQDRANFAHAAAVRLATPAPAPYPEDE